MKDTIHSYDPNDDINTEQVSPYRAFFSFKKYNSSSAILMPFSLSVTVGSDSYLGSLELFYRFQTRHDKSWNSFA